MKSNSELSENGEDDGFKIEEFTVDKRRRNSSYSRRTKTESIEGKTPKKIKDESEIYSKLMIIKQPGRLEDIEEANQSEFERSSRHLSSYKPGG